MWYLADEGSQGLNSVITVSKTLVWSGLLRSDLVWSSLVWSALIWFDLSGLV